MKGAVRRQPWRGQREARREDEAAAAKERQRVRAHDAHEARGTRRGKHEARTRTLFCADALVVVIEVDAGACRFTIARSGLS